MPSLSFRLHFHPTPQPSDPSGTFDSESEFDAYKDFEQKQTFSALRVYRTAYTKDERRAAAKSLAHARKTAYKRWKNLCDYYLPDGESA